MATGFEGAGPKSRICNRLPKTIFPSPPDSAGESGFVTGAGFQLSQSASGIELQAVREIPIAIAQLLYLLSWKSGPFRPVLRCQTNGLYAPVLRGHQNFWNRFLPNAAELFH